MPTRPPRSAPSSAAGWRRRPATRASLGAGAPRPLSTDANHMFLAVLPGRYWHSSLRVSVVEHGRTIAPSAISTQAVPPVLMVPQARAPDPGGGAPWGYVVSADGATAYGRILDGRLAGISERDGAIRNGPMGWSSGEPCRERRRRSVCPFANPRTQMVEFDVHGGAGGGPSRRSRPRAHPTSSRAAHAGRSDGHHRACRTGRSVGHPCYAERRTHAAPGVAGSGCSSSSTTASSSAERSPRRSCCATGER